MAATEIYFKTEYTDDQDLEIEDVKHQIIGNTDEHKHIDYRLRYLLYELPAALLFSILFLTNRYF